MRRNMYRVFLTVTNSDLVHEEVIEAATQFEAQQLMIEKYPAYSSCWAERIDDNVNN